MELLRNVLPTGVQYSELRKHHLVSTKLSLMDGNLVENRTDESQGLNARTFNQGCWGCAASPVMDMHNAIRLGRVAKDNVISLSAFSEPKDIHSASCHIDRVLALKSVWSTSEKIDLLKAIHDIAEKKYPRLSSMSCMLLEEHHRKEMCNSFGSTAHTEMVRSVLFVKHTVMNANNEPIQLFDFFGGRGLIADLQLGIPIIEAKMDQLYQWVLDKCESVPAKAGLVDCIIGPNITGVLAHEALGHPCEADLVKGGSITGGLLGEKVASDVINMVDFAHSYEDELLPVPVFVDDEGVEAQDVTLVENGILKGFMHNRETAAEMGVEPTGNARAYMFEDEPLIRMRNTLILPGKSKLDDMISDMEDGYLLLRTANGQADTTTEFMFGVPLGYEVKNGKIGPAIQDTTVSGTAIDMLKTVTAVSDKIELKSAGYCGKKQRMVVSMGGPALRCKINIGGGKA